MLADFKSADEAGRHRALLRYSVLDTGEEAPFERIVAIVQHVLDVPICAVSLIDADRQWFKAQRGLDTCQTDRSVAFCDHTIRTADALIIQDAARDIRFAANPLVTGSPHIRAYIGVPLVTPEGYAVGGICAIDTRPRDFGPGDVLTLRSLGDVIVTELELRLLASTDMLSGLLARRAFMDQVNIKIDAAAGQRGGLAVMMIDLDGFKAINDRLGHAAGDDVIRQVGGVLHDLSDERDIVGRIGGEEFALLMPCATITAALERAEALRIALARRIRLATGDGVTASIGVALVDAAPDALSTALRRADLALYRAKSLGRNRVATADMPLAQAS